MTNTSLESGSHNTDDYMKIFMCGYTRTQKHPCQPWGKNPTQTKKPKLTMTNPLPKQTSNKKENKQNRKSTTETLKCILKRLIRKDPQKF